MTQRRVPSLEGGSVSADGHAALVDFQITGDDLEARDRLGPVERAVAASARRTPGCSSSSSAASARNKELNETFTSDLGKAELLSLPLTLFILIVAFGSLVAAGVPLLLAISSRGSGHGADRAAEPDLAGRQQSPSVILLIGLAVGVDYSLFYIRREREERRADRRGRRSRSPPPPRAAPC